MKADLKSMTWIMTPLLLIALGIAIIVYVALPLPGARLGGGFFLGIGIINILSHKQIGRRIFTLAQSSWPFVVRFWARIGETGAQLLFLGIGVILTIAGCILLVVGNA
jgi:hypothetical protein